MPFEGLGIGPRARSQKYSSLTPMNRMVDAARPESESVRALTLAANKVAANGKAATAELALLRRAFTLWAANDARFQELAGDDPLLAELKPVSKDLAALGNAGLKLLDAVEKRQPLPAGFAAAQRKELTRMEKPMVELTLAATRPVKALLK